MFHLFFLVFLIFLSKSEAVGTSGCDPRVRYQAHLAQIGWQQGWFYDGEVAGTTGQSRRLEAIRIELQGCTQGMGVKYSAHLEAIGWQPWVESGVMAGTTGQSRRLEAIKIELTRRPSTNVHIQYRAHLQGHGWQGWVQDGQVAGTTGQSRRLEAIQIRILSSDCKCVPNIENCYSLFIGDLK